MSSPALAVQLLAIVSEDRMIAEFVRAEVDSSIHGALLSRKAADLDIDLSVVRRPDIDSDEQNRARRKLLEAYRGWGSYESVFGGLPAETVVWWAALLDRTSIDRVEVIQWLVDEYPSAFPARRLGEIRRIRHPPGSAVPESASEMSRALQNGKQPASPILIARPELDRLVILEGHNRMLAYANLADAAPAGLEVILGVTADAASWSEW